MNLSMSPRRFITTISIGLIILLLYCSLQAYSLGRAFVVAYPDDMLLRGPSLAGQLVAEYERSGKTVLAGQELPEGAQSFGVSA